jgi:hypothetical protein
LGSLVDRRGGFYTHCGRRAVLNVRAVHIISRRRSLAVRFTRHKHDVPNITAAWLLPVVTLTVAASTGGVVAIELTPEYARLTVQLWFVHVLRRPLVADSLSQLRFAGRRTLSCADDPSALPPASHYPQGTHTRPALAHRQQRPTASTRICRGLRVSSYRALRTVCVRATSARACATGRGIVLAGTEGAALTDAVSALSFVLAFLLFGLGAWWLALALITIGRTAMYGGFPFNMFAVLQKRQIKEY